MPLDIYSRMSIHRVSTTAMYVATKCEDILMFRIHEDVYNELKNIESYKRPTITSPWIYGGSAPYSVKYGRDPKTMTMLIIDRYAPDEADIVEFYHGYRYKIRFLVKYIECPGYSKFLTELESVELLEHYNDDSDSKPVTVEPTIIETQDPSVRIPITYTTIARVDCIFNETVHYLDPERLQTFGCTVPAPLVGETERLKAYLDAKGDPDKYEPANWIFDNWHVLNAHDSKAIFHNRRSTGLNLDWIVEGAYCKLTYQCDYVQHASESTKIYNTLLAAEPIDYVHTVVECDDKPATLDPDRYKPRIVDMSIRLGK